MIFYINISRSTQGAKQDDLSNLKAVEISQTISFMPEFQCSFKNIVDENCFDIMKINAFRQYVETDTLGMRSYNTTYYDLFEYSQIIVYEIYPKSVNSWLIYNRTEGADITNKKNTFIPISLYNATTNQYTYGILNVTVYS